MTDKTFYYFGDDKVFFSGLKSMLDLSSQNSIKLKRFFATQEVSIQSLFCEVAEGLPDAVLIDFSLYSEDYLHLARILSRTPFDKDIRIIGIFDHSTDSRTLIDAQSTGISLSFIKSDHIKDIGLTLMRLLAPEKFNGPSFVKVKVNEKWITGLTSKIGFITETGLHFETNLKFNVGEEVRLEHFWRNKTLIPSKEITVRHVDESNIVYNFSYGVDADFEFVDSIQDQDPTPEEEVKRFELIDDVKYRFKRMFLRLLPNSRPKKVKVLFIDSSFSIYRDNKRTDRFPYMLRCLGSNKNILTEMTKFNPQIIVFSIDGENITQETVIEVMESYIQQGNTPYIIIFNTEMPVKDWQTTLNYSNLLASAEEINIEILTKIASIFEKKIKSLETNQSKKVFISNSKEESNCEIELTVDVKMLSECDIQFSSSRKIPLGSNLIIKSPIQTLIYISSEQEDKGLFHYQGILHSHDELQKNSIRRFINATLFKENEVQIADKHTLVTQDTKLKEILKNSQLKSED
ncbi:MAG: hypothetical protein WDA09_05855 [Bacteriovoracaceae bacterium]